MRRRWLLLALAVQVALLLAVAAPSLLVRVTGTEYRLAMVTYDPIDPVRGAYLDLRLVGTSSYSAQGGTVFVPLRRTAGGRYRGAGALATPPRSGPYLRCDAGSGEGLSCGIESLFLSQGDARRAGVRSSGRGGLTVRAKVGLGGRAVLLGLG